jgi:hypothetical protein
MTAAPFPDLDTALIVGMASTAIPFARSREEEAERWLRILRLHGEAGVALQALGVSEAPLEAVPDDAQASPVEFGPQGTDVVAAVSEAAIQSAEQRGASHVGTDDVLLAVMDIYGADFNRVLHVHGTDRDEVLERLHAEAA